MPGTWHAAGRIDGHIYAAFLVAHTANALVDASFSNP